MSNTLRVTVVTGPHKNQKFCLHDQGECLVGRGSDCFIQLAGTGRDGLISRHHCRLSLDADNLKIEDLGSLNGTFINGKKVGCLELKLPHQTGYESCQCEEESCAGNLVTVGGTTLRIDVVDCPPREANAEVAWEPGESAKKNCPAHCEE